MFLACSFLFLLVKNASHTHFVLGRVLKGYLEKEDLSKPKGNDEIIVESVIIWLNIDLHVPMEDATYLSSFSGNCSSRYMRSTLYNIPCNQDMLKESNVPMAILTTPFAKIPADEVGNNVACLICQ